MCGVKTHTNSSELIMLGVLLGATIALTLDAVQHHQLLGRKVALLSGALPRESDSVLDIADAALKHGASLRLIIPTPASGEVASDDASMKLLQLSVRKDFPALMEALGFQFGGVAGQYGTGNRPRVDFVHVRADDTEAFNLELADCDLLLLHTPSERLSDERLESARWRLQRRAYTFVVRRLRQDGLRLQRDSGGVRVHWAWLHQVPPSASKDQPDEVD